MICQLGGQTPLRLAHDLEAAGYRVLGTPASAIDLAEDRGKFAELLQELGIAAPPHGEARDMGEARAVAARIGYPVVVRPSYVLGGRWIKASIPSSSPAVKPTCACRRPSWGQSTGAFGLSS